MLTDLYPWLAPLLVAASAWLLIKATGLHQYITHWALLMDPNEDAA